MQSFFHGWRRKAGSAMLLMALLFAGAWCRSQYQVDIIAVECGTTRQTLASTEGRLVWDQRQNGPLGRTGTAGYSMSIQIDLSDKVDKTRFRYLNDWSINWRRKWWGVRIWRSSADVRRPCVLSNHPLLVCGVHSNLPLRLPDALEATSTTQSRSREDERCMSSFEVGNEKWAASCS
jgi:hypothetical protein